jgi:hypothetical protein
MPQAVRPSAHHAGRQAEQAPLAQPQEQLPVQGDLEVFADDEFQRRRDPHGGQRGQQGPQAEDHGGTVHGADGHGDGEASRRGRRDARAGGDGDGCNRPGEAGNRTDGEVDASLEDVVPAGDDHDGKSDPGDGEDRRLVQDGGKVGPLQEMR